jgi:hypothetical protein
MRARDRYLLVLMIGGALGCDEYVRFGPPQGLRAEEGGNVEACMPEAAKALDCAAAPDWATAIFTPMFDQTMTGSKYGCTNDNCHGVADGGGLRMVPGDALGSYDALAAYANGTLKYIGPDPLNSYILCNLQTKENLLIGNQPMPVVGGDIMSFVSPEDMLIIGHWVNCGAPRTGTPVMTGAGGGGGAGGAGGAGL